MDIGEYIVHRKREVQGDYYEAFALFDSDDTPPLGTIHMKNRALIPLVCVPMRDPCLFPVFDQQEYFNTTFWHSVSIVIPTPCVHYYAYL